MKLEEAHQKLKQIENIPFGLLFTPKEFAYQETLWLFV